MTLDTSKALTPNPSPKAGRGELDLNLGLAFLPFAQGWERGLGGEGQTSRHSSQTVGYKLF
ncbi:hypothetical protein AM1_1971 [Acaryochloris marina MBIC11017]|uniref:Uncharacterized protein n=1 Tax=Acaryochloris marina (strain MBIC 11017) TaxID=329726 RepID=B0CFG9_ACAM1|nr:hypothetical protein AM1_1971 [Acaryochloris marina MBIC11017]